VRSRWWLLLAGLVLVGGSLVVWLAPGVWFDLVLQRFIGAPGAHAHTTMAQRLIALVGVALASLVIAVWAGVSRARLPRVAAWRLVVLAVPVGPLLVSNLTWVALALGLVAAPWRPEGALQVFLIVAQPLGWLAVLVERPVAASWSRLALASGAGLAYGCVSALWHCCPPLWDSPWHWWPWLLGLSLALGGAGRLASSLRAPVGELVGGLAFACFYPFHTWPWFVQCALAGALATQLVRLTGSGFAPALFLASAFVSHMSLPFLGIWGVLLAAMLLAGHAWLARAEKEES
jgi:hypothetical protein